MVDDLRKLAPLPMIQQADKITVQLAELIVHAAARSPQNVLVEIYMAGLWHGCELSRATLSDSSAK